MITPIKVKIDNLDKIIRWGNVGILLAVLLVRRWQMTLARCNFAHRADLIANGWFDVGPTLKKLCICQRNANHSLSSILLIR